MFNAFLVIYVLLFLPNLTEKTKMNISHNDVFRQVVELGPDGPHVVDSERGEGRGLEEAIVSMYPYVAVRSTSSGKFRRSETSEDRDFKRFMVIYFFR